MDDKGRFPHHMLKEIFEQPQALRDTVAPRLSLDEGVVRLDDVRITSDELCSLQRINIVASGTSRHAGMAGQFMIQDLANVPVDVDYASEFEYRNPLICRNELTIVITQSGETADTSAAQREAKLKGSRTIAISNVMDSTIAREADGVLYTHAGPEISIASTKAFTAQMAVLFLFAVYLGQVRGKLTKDQVRHIIRELLELPTKTETVLESASELKKLADQYHQVADFLFLGRAIHYPIAMDGALKLKEVSYVHAEGYPTGETKHGPNALIDESLPVVIVATCDHNDQGSVLRYEKNVANIRGFKQQSARVIAIASEGDDDMRKLADHTIFIPQTPELLSPILEIIPLQLFAYYMAVRKGLDVDRPRNLVKSVTLE
ncbi:MAG TPA: glutamine--fructose-6-phosphate transaminase (isomerizing), partial [Terriglobales bacterium]|jgi:glucosamine--fructose-6-phosphate aminotransferase (isomerizing)|nr:glutamine--fructose-6-phosphate transaminase (isomerizing) [Terriglobales bacterium]